MKHLQTLSLILRSSVTTLREKIEDPERMLEQILIDMDEELERLRASVAEAIADEIQLRKSAESARTEVLVWLERAQRATIKGDEAAAREALDRKLQSEKQAQQLELEYEEQRRQTRELRRSVEQLETKIRQARQKRTLLVARLARSESRKEIDGALKRASGNSAFAQFSRLEARVEREEAKQEAYESLAGNGVSDEVEERFVEEEMREQIDTEYEALKRRLREEE